MEEVVSSFGVGDAGVSDVEGDAGSVVETEVGVVELEEVELSLSEDVASGVEEDGVLFASGSVDDVPVVSVSLEGVSEVSLETVSAVVGDVSDEEVSVAVSEVVFVTSEFEFEVVPLSVIVADSEDSSIVVGSEILFSAVVGYVFDSVCRFLADDWSVSKPPTKSIKKITRFIVFIPF